MSRLGEFERSKRAKAARAGGAAASVAACFASIGVLTRLAVIQATMLGSHTHVIDPILLDVGGVDLLMVRPRLRPGVPRTTSIPQARRRAARPVAPGGVEPELHLEDDVTFGWDVFLDPMPSQFRSTRARDDPNASSTGRWR